MQLHSQARTGRGAVRDLPNRFEKLAMDLDPDVVQPDPSEENAGAPNPKTQFLDDQSESIIVKNESPDVGFSAGINPYRGCEHGCAYCYARPYHEYLAFPQASISRPRSWSSNVPRSCCAASSPGRSTSRRCSP